MFLRQPRMMKILRLTIQASLQHLSVPVMSFTIGRVIRVTNASLRVHPPTTRAVTLILLVVISTGIRITAALRTIRHLTRISTINTNRITVNHRRLLVNVVTTSAVVAPQTLITHSPTKISEDHPNIIDSNITDRWGFLIQLFLLFFAISGSTLLVIIYCVNGKGRVKSVGVKMYVSPAIVWVIDIDFYRLCENLETVWNEA